MNPMARHRTTRSLDTRLVMRYPQLAAFPAGERADVLRRCRHQRTTPAEWIMLVFALPFAILAGALIGVLAAVGCTYGLGLLELLSIRFVDAAGYTVGTATCIGFVHLFFVLDRAGTIRERLNKAARATGSCAWCGYTLEGLVPQGPVLHCPECGGAILTPGAQPRRAIQNQPPPAATPPPPPPRQVRVPKRRRTLSRRTEPAARR